MNNTTQTTNKVKIIPYGPESLTQMPCPVIDDQLVGSEACCACSHMVGDRRESNGVFGEILCNNVILWPMPSLQSYKKIACGPTMWIVPCTMIDGQSVGSPACISCMYNEESNAAEQYILCSNKEVWSDSPNTVYMDTCAEYPQTRAPKNTAQEGKPDLSLLPMDLLEGLARAYEYGCYKYSRNSWRKGFPQSEMIAASRRHDSDFWEKGEFFDKEAEEAGFKVDHISMQIFNLLCVLDAELNHPQFCDRHNNPNKG